MTEVSDAGVRKLSEMQSLRKLSLRFNRRVSEAGLVHLAGAPALERLDLYGAEVSGSSVAERLPHVVVAP